MTEFLPEKITKCQYSSCDVEFGRIANKKQMCICCHKVFCDAHACEYKLIEHLLGNHLPNIEEVCHKKGYICQDCLASDGLSCQCTKRHSLAESARIHVVTKAWTLLYHH